MIFAEGGVLARLLAELIALRSLRNHPNETRPKAGRSCLKLDMGLLSSQVSARATPRRPLAPVNPTRVGQRLLIGHCCCWSPVAGNLASSHTTLCWAWLAPLAADGSAVDGVVRCGLFSALPPVQMNWTRIPHIPSMITVATIPATIALPIMNRSANTLLTPCPIMTTRAPAPRCARTKNTPSQ